MLPDAPWSMAGDVALTHAGGGTKGPPPGAELVDDDGVRLGVGNVD
jgi:hypothetical protein